MYADEAFYLMKYYGKIIPKNKSNDIYRFLERASDELDTITFGRLLTAFPTNEAHAAKVKKAVCAVAEVLYRIEEHQKAADAHKDSSGNYVGAISSIKAGEESITYAAVNSAASVYSSAAVSTAERNKLIAETAARYIANIPDANGTNLLYAGGDKDV